MAPLDSATGTERSLGFLHVLKAYLATWVDLLKTRLELFSTELQEERENLQQVLILGAAALLCVGLGALLATFFVVALFWETSYRLVVLGGFALFYFAGGALVAFVARRKIRDKPKILSATLHELAKDYTHLSTRP